MVARDLPAPAPWDEMRSRGAWARSTATRGWGWPGRVGRVAFVGATILALFHQQLDLSTYLLGGAHASSNDLFTVTYPTDHLGFTYPPFSALLFGALRPLPAAGHRGGFLLDQPGRAVRADRRSLRAVCAALWNADVLWWASLAAVVVHPGGRQTSCSARSNIGAHDGGQTMDLPIRRGILVGLAAAIKVTPIILIPYLFLTRQGRSGVRAIGAFAGAALLATAFNASTSWSYLDPFTSATRSEPGCCRGSGTRVSSARPSACWVTR